MLKLRLPKLVALGIFALGIFSTAYADITPLRTGPVSQYGMLMTGINSQNEGRVYGSCNAYSNASGNEVQVKGMSLFWSNEKSQNRFWRNDVITGMVSQQGIQVIRAAMAVDDQGWGNGHYFVNGKTEYYQDLLDETVQAAIEQDIYVIIDYHSHTAVDNVGRAKEFFKIQAKKWGSYPNVIFEIYNEPICKAGQGHGNSSNCTMITWPEIKAYANEVIPIIRRYSNNLIVVGTPSWSGNPGAVVGNAITGYDNIAYTFHYYAGKDDGSDAHDFISMSADVNSAIGAGLSVFVTEWGTVGYEGDGAPSTANNPQWQTWMNLKKLSSANWNAGRNTTKDGAENSEYFANFDVDKTSPADWTYSASGDWVNANVFNGLSAVTYSSCANHVTLPAVPASDPNFDDSGDDFGDVYEDEVINHDYVIDDFDGHNSANEYHYFFESGDKGDWTNGNGGKSTFFVDGSNVGGVVGVVTGNNGWAGYGVHVETLKGCETFSYRFRGLAHGFTLGDKVAQSVTGSGDWVKMTFDLTGIDPDDLDAPFTIQWQVTGPSSGDSLLVDDVQCGDPSSGSNDPLPPYMIDDFETDGDGYAWPYMIANGTTTIGNDENEYGYVVRFPEAAAPGSVYGIGLVGVTTTGTSWADAVLVKEVSGLSSGCSVISYQYKGGAHFFKAVDPALNIEAVSHDVHRISVGGSDSWKTVWIDVSDLKQWGHNDVLDLSKVTSLRWEMNNDNGSSNLTNVDLFVDNVRCAAEDEAREYVIDDFDGTQTLPNWAFVWDGTSTILNTPNAYGSYDAVFDGVGYGDTKAAGIQGLSGTGASLAIQTSSLKGCEAIQYKYKGGAHNLWAVVNDNDELGPHTAVTPSNEWKTETLLVSELNASPSNIAELRWALAYDEDYNYLYVDDVECVNAPASSIVAQAYLISDFQGGGRSDWNKYGGYDYVYANEDWSFSNEWLQPSWCEEASCWEYQKTVNDPTQGVVGTALNVVSGENGDAGVGVHTSNLDGCATVQYKYKGLSHKFSVYNFENDATTNYVVSDNTMAFASGWTTVTYDMNEAVAKGVDLSKPINVQWEVQAPANGESFYVDDVRCIIDGAPESSSSAEESSSSVSYEEYLVADFEDGGDKKSTGDYAFAWGSMGIGNDNPCADNDPDTDDCHEHIFADAHYSGINGAALKGITYDESQYGGEAAIDVMVPNLQGCYTLKYRYKGAGHAAALHIDNAYDVRVGYTSSATEWSTAYVKVKKQSLDMVTDIRFIVDYLSASDPNYLYIDDVECVVQNPPLPKPNAPTTNTQLVEDFEDGDDMPLWSEVGNWWLDANNATTAGYKFVKGSQSSKAMQANFNLNGAGIDYDPYMAISSGFNNVNLTNCTEVRYDYKGAAHKFRIKFSEEVNDILDLDWNFHSYPVSNRSESWQTVTIPLSSLRQQYCDEDHCDWGSYVHLDSIMRRVSGFDWRIDGATGTQDSLAIDNIQCIGLAQTQYYTVTFKNGEETFASKSWAAGSNVPDPEGIPTKAQTAQYIYTFNYWEFDEYEFNEDTQEYYLENGKRIPIRRVTADAIHEAVYDSTLRAYAISFLNDDGSELTTNYDVDYGTPIVDIAPEDPTKEATAEWTYTFAGWNPFFDAQTQVTGEASFTATFNGTKNQYSVTFVDDDDAVLKAATLYDYGTPFDQIAAPLVSDKDGGWKFAGWIPNPAAVTDNVTYRAVYTQQFIITWKDDDGSVLRYDYHDAGETADYGEAPTKAATAEWTYTFAGWNPAVPEQVTEDAAYTATYIATKNQYHVAFVDENGEIGDAMAEYEYGTNVSSIAPIPTKAGNAQWTYTFTGWAPAITDQTIVTGTETYTAQFSATENSYTVSFGGCEGAQNVPAARTAVYRTTIASLLPAEDPFKPATNESTFEFVKWTYSDGTDIGENDVLEDDVTLKAVFTEFVRRYAVTFIDYDNTVLKAATLYEYGATVMVPDEDPTRAPAGIYTYDFHGWTPAVVPVEGEAIYKATYDSTAHYGAIAISVIDGKETATIDGSYTDGDVVNIPNSIEVDTVVFNRTFSASGYSTITLPFSINRSAIEGVSKVLTFTGIGYDENGKKQVEMEEVTGELSAYKPYMVELTSEGGLVFHGNSMVIQPTEGANTVVQSDDGWEFRGTLSKIVWDEKHPDLGRVYGFSAKEANNVRIGQFVKAGKGAWINPFRAYMIYNEGNSAGKSAGHAYVSAEPLPDYMDVVVVSRGATGEESKTVIGGINTRTGEFKMMQDYDLKGRKLNGKPTARGVYYGKKKIIK